MIAARGTVTSTLTAPGVTPLADKDNSIGVLIVFAIVAARPPTLPVVPALVATTITPITPMVPLLLPSIVAPSSPSTPFEPLAVMIVVVSTAVRSSAIFAMILAGVAAFGTSPRCSAAAGVVSLVASCAS